MNIDSKREPVELTEWEIDQRTKRDHLSFAQYHLILVRGLMRQWKMTNDAAHAMAMSRFPMSSHSTLDELAVRGLRLSLSDIEEFWFELHNELIDSQRLQWSAMSIENFVNWAIARGRAKPIEERTPHIQQLLADREFIKVAHEIESAILEMSEGS